MPVRKLVFIALAAAITVASPVLAAARRPVVFPAANFDNTCAPCRDFDQYVNLRPVRLMPGVPCPLANRKVGDIDMMIVRENTEGEYSAVGGRMFAGTERETYVSFDDGDHWQSLRLNMPASSIRADQPVCAR